MLFWCIIFKCVGKSKGYETSHIPENMYILSELIMVLMFEPFIPDLVSVSLWLAFDVIKCCWPGISTITSS